MVVFSVTSHSPPECADLGTKICLEFGSVEFKRGRKCSWLVHSDFRKLRLIAGVFGRPDCCCWSLSPLSSNNGGVDFGLVNGKSGDNGRE